MTEFKSHGNAIIYTRRVKADEYDPDVIWFGQVVEYYVDVPDLEKWGIDPEDFMKNPNDYKIIFSSFSDEVLKIIKKI